MNPNTNFENDYLWDKSGEPDPEIQQLEEILGSLRYQPRPLEIPADLQANIHIRRERSFFRSFAPGLAIAATVALVLLGLGLWIGLQRLQRTQPSEIVNNPRKPAINSNAVPSTVPPTVTSPDQNREVSASASNDQDQKQIATPHRHRVNPSQLAGNTNRSRDAAREELVKDSAVAANELQEGAAAREQLMLALRVACTKVNFAQRKAQESTNPRDLIHNQHRIG